MVDATAARLARALPTEACEPWSHSPGPCYSGSSCKLEMMIWKENGVPGKNRQKATKLSLVLDLLREPMLKHAEPIPRIFKQQYEQRRLQVACCPVLWKESWFLTSLPGVQFSATGYVQPFSSIWELTLWTFFDLPLRGTDSGSKSHSPSTSRYRLQIKLNLSEDHQNVTEHWATPLWSPQPLCKLHKMILFR